MVRRVRAEGGSRMSVWFHMEYESCLKITAKAALFAIEDRQLWIPLSVIAPEDAKVLEEGDVDGSICVADWFARKEGLL